MEYTATKWKKGDAITAESLNKIEEALEELAALTEKEHEVVEVDSTEEIEKIEPATDTKAKKG